MRLSWLFSVLLVLAWGAALAQLAGKITSVTVYRGEALVTRQVEFAAAAGAQELVVSPLPEGVAPASLYATGDAEMTIRAVRYRVTAVGEEPREEVRALDAKIADAQKTLKRIASEAGVLDSRGRYLDKLENFVAPSATAELSKGVLDPKSLIETSAYLFEQRAQIASAKLALDDERMLTEQTLNTLNRERNTLMAGTSKTQREAVILIDSAKAHAARCELSYLVSGVNWSPAYSARLNKAQDKLALEYSAVVSQASGEDWSNVMLTLSTTRPNMTADAPILSPLWVNLVENEGENAVDKEQYDARVRELNMRLRAGKTAGPSDLNNLNDIGQQGAWSGTAAVNPGAPGEAFQFELAQNSLASQLQSLELAADEEAVRKQRRNGPELTEGMAVSYALPGLVSLQSRADQQMFRIATLDLKADAYYFAVPLLTEYVYLAADAVNTSEIPLLPGPYNAYVDGGFAGRGWLPLVAMGQGLTVGFGTETQLRTARILEDKTSEVRGGNQRVTYKYRLRLQNFMNRMVKVRLWDRIPQAVASQVTVALNEPRPALSAEANYQSEDRPKGLLRWDLDVPAQAVKSKALEVTYQLQMEYDKSYRIGEQPSDETEELMKKDFRQRMELRFNNAQF